jgi:glycosyltransferase involved in cell wall biosynthesis
MLVYFVNHSSALDHLGGAERSLIKLVQDWYASDPEFEAFFITKAPSGKFVEAIDRLGWHHKAFRYRGWTIPKKKLSPGETLYFARDDYSATGQIISLMENRRPDLVVTNTLVAPWGAFAAKVLGIPHAWFVREFGDLDHGMHFQSGRAGTLEDIGLLSEAVFANSFAVKAHLGRHLDEAKVSIVYPQLDRARIAELAAQQPDLAPFPQPDPGLRITVVGRLADSKGQWRVVDAVGMLAKRGITASICFVGAPMEADHDLKLMRRARQLGLASHVVIADEQENPFPFVVAADVCVTPSAYEAFGRATLEYLTLGKPVVATNTGGSAELVDPEVNGLLFDPDDVRQLAAALERYATDPGLRAEHGAASLKMLDRLQSHEFSNAAAIDRLRTTATAIPYRLPNVARFWFEIPGMLYTAQAGSRVTARYALSRLRSMSRNFARHPIASVRRRLRA